MQSKADNRRQLAKTLADYPIDDYVNVHQKECTQLMSTNLLKKRIYADIFKIRNTKIDNIKKMVLKQ
jgi:23S rRNA maturation-related 3'-5' exoribonuclease YhaM